MIASGILGPLALLSIGVQQSLAEWNGPLKPEFTLPSSVKADTEFTVGIKNNLTNTEGWTVYNVYLAFTVPGVDDPTTACSLATKVKLDTAEIKAKIPADVAPDSTKMWIKEIMFVNSPYENLTSPNLQSGESFTFQGGKGEFATFEKKGGSVPFTELIPCSAYKCARDCVSANFKEDNADYDFKKDYECIAKCPGSKYTTWDDYLKQTGQDDTSSSSATATATSSSVSTAGATSNPSSQTSGSDASATTSAPTSTTTDSGSGHLLTKKTSLLLVGLVASYGLF